MTPEIQDELSAIVNLGGRVALVTGAGQGIGRQVARKLVANGAGGVIVNDYFADRAEAVAAEIRAAGGQAISIEGDVTVLESVKAVVAKGIERFGRIDVLVNNAGSSGANPTENVRQPFWETGPESWDNFIAVNFYGVINCVSAVLPAMIERKSGRIITIISEAGRVGEIGLEVYSGAKAGAAGFSRAVARTLGRHNITVNTVSVAATLTPTTEHELDALSPEQKKRWLEKYVIRRFGKPDDVANMVVFLASEENSWITGQNYPVNGGFSLAL